MMNYPEHYAPLTEEEMEYVNGGFSINWLGLGATVLGLGTSMLLYMNVGNIAGVSNQLQQADPDKYPEPEGTINGRLMLDATVAYFTSPNGALLSLANVAAAVGTVFLTAKSGS